MNSPLWHLIGVQFKSFFREPGVIFWAIVFPILISWVLGVAFSSKPDSKAKVMVIGQIAFHSLQPRDSQKENTFTKRFGDDLEAKTSVTFLAGTSEKEAFTSLRKGEISLFITSENGRLIYHYDPHNQEARAIHLLIDRELNPPKVSSQLKPVNAIGSRYIDFLIPGLIAFGIMNSCLWGISYNLIEYRIKKLLRRMVATPMKKITFFLSIMIARVVLCSLETIFLILFAFLYFGTRITGSVFALLLVYLSGIVLFSGIAILVSSRTSNSQVGNGIINAVILPMTIMSGVFFNYHNFPEWSISVISFLPLTLLVDCLRGIFMEGNGVSEVLLSCIFMNSMGLLLSAIGLRIYKWY